MDRNATLVADEGMRILSPEIRTNAPYFIASNDELWEVWRDIQKRGSLITYISEWAKRGWKITSRREGDFSS